MVKAPEAFWDTGGPRGMGKVLKAFWETKGNGEGSGMASEEFWDTGGPAKGE